MTTSAMYIAKIVALNGGQLTGKTRLQKTAYFLEEFNLGNDADFEYYYYGPYSEEISTAADDARALGYISTEWNRTKAGTEFAIFKSNIEIPSNKEDRRRQKILSILDRYDAVSVELAATADFLSKNGYGDDPWGETARRKEDKATQERLDKAKSLLSALNQGSQA